MTFFIAVFKLFIAFTIAAGLWIVHHDWKEKRKDEINNRHLKF